MQKNSKYSIQILHPKNGKRNSWLLKCGLCIVTSFQRKESRKEGATLWQRNHTVEKPTETTHIQVTKIDSDSCSQVEMQP